MTARPCLFLDRDGVINVKPSDGGYVRHWGEFTFLEPVFDWVRLFATLDYLVIVLTNQRGIARGLMTEADLAAVHARLRAEFAARGLPLDDVFHCPHDEGQCDCRKPRLGLLRQAQAKWPIDLARSLFVGDSDSDAQMAAAAGLRFVRVKDGRTV